MKKVLFILLLSSWTWADCPLYTYPENHKLDQEINNLCQQVQNPIGNQLAYSSGTFQYLGVSTATFTGRVTVRNGTVSTDAVALGQMKVFQIVSTTTVTSFSTTSSSYKTTILSGAITPTSASNQIFLIATGSLDVTVQAKTAHVTLARNGTNILAASGGVQVFTITGGDTGFATTVMFTDSPATTSQIIYSVQIKNDDNATSIQYGTNPTQVLTMMEVGATVP